MNKTVLEPAKEVKVSYEADVVVVGGGPAGQCAAVAAARNGAKTILVERYGHLGGMASGGLVILIPHMSDGSGEQQIAGLCQEWVDRLDAVGGALHPKREELGSTDEKIVAKYKPYNYIVARDGTVRQNVFVDPELLKCVLNDMTEDAGVKLLLHSWGSRPIMGEGKVQGIIFDSKSGTQAIQSRVVIDATGDGDIFASAGAEFDGAADHELRTSQLALVFRIGNADYLKYSDFRAANPEKYNEAMKEIKEETGIRYLPVASTRDDVLWINNWLPGYSALDVEDLTTVEVKVRKDMLTVHKLFKKHFPGFENSYILDTASQIGTRGSRRLAGEYVLTKDDISNGTCFDDTIAVFPKFSSAGGNQPFAYIPYRSLVPAKIEGLLAAGRCFSSDAPTNNMFNLIPHCAAMGEAAGTAAALAIKNGVSPRQVDIRKLQSRLIDQNVPLPGV